MSGKVLVGGTGYAVKAGKVLVGGTAYTIKKGRTLIGGTGYDINLKSKVNFSVNVSSGVSALFYITLSDGTRYEIQGTDSAQEKNYELKTGETVTLTLVQHIRDVFLYANGVPKTWDNTPFAFTVTKDCSLTANWSYDSTTTALTEIFQLTY